MKQNYLPSFKNKVSIICRSVFLMTSQDLIWNIALKLSTL